MPATAMDGGVDWNLVEVRRGLRDMRRAGADLKPVLRRLRTPLRKELQAYAERESGPDGRWPRRAQPTEVRVPKRASTHTFKRGRGKKAVREERRMTNLLGKLPAITNVTARRENLAAINPVDWSAAQNEGAVVGRGSVIEARPFVFLSEEFLDLAEAKLLEYILKKGWERRG